MDSQADEQSTSARLKVIKYSEKLQDPRWQKKRLEILSRDDWQCQLCGERHATLVVHHRRYLPGCDPWDYPDSFLVTLCVDCHTGEREALPEAEQRLLAILRLRFFADDLSLLIRGFERISESVDSSLLAMALEELLSSPTVLQDLLQRAKETIFGSDDA